MWQWWWWEEEFFRDNVPGLLLAHRRPIGLSGVGSKQYGGSKSLVTLPHGARCMTFKALPSVLQFCLGCFLLDHELPREPGFLLILCSVPTLCRSPLHITELGKCLLNKYLIKYVYPVKRGHPQTECRSFTMNTFSPLILYCGFCLLWVCSDIILLFKCM